MRYHKVILIRLKAKVNNNYGEENSGREDCSNAVWFEKIVKIFSKILPILT